MSGILLLLGLAYCQWADSPLPMSLDASLIAVFFIVCGDYYMRYQATINRGVKRYWIFLIVIILLSIVFNFDKIEMYGMSYGFWVPFVFGSISSIVLICYLCKQILCNNKFCGVIMEYGKLSLLVFATHYYCLFIPITLKNRLLHNNMLWQDYMYWIVSLTIGLFIVLPICKLLNNKAKWLTGK